MKKLVVLLPVYNSEEFLDEAILSLYNQTFTNFDIIACDDGSTDNSYQILSKYKKKYKNFIIIKNSINLGIIKTRNLLLAYAKDYEYIALMDSDDISQKDRFELQISYLSRNKGTLAVSSDIMIIPFNQIIKFSKFNNLIRERMLFTNLINNPSSMFKNEVITKYNLKYDENLKSSEDYDFWLKVLNHGEIYIIPKILLHYRRHGKQETTLNRERQDKSRNKIIINYFSTLEIKLSEDDILLLLEPHNIESINKLNRLIMLFKIITTNNEINKLYNSKKLKELMKDNILIALKHLNKIQAYYYVLSILDFRILPKVLKYLFFLFLYKFKKGSNLPNIQANKLLKKVKSHNIKDFNIYCAGEITKHLITQTRNNLNIKIEQIFDIKAINSEYSFNSFKIKSPEKIKNINNKVIVIASYEYKNEVYEYLKKLLDEDISDYIIIQL